MTGHRRTFAALLLQTLLLTGCASFPSETFTTGAVSEEDNTLDRKRGTPVVAQRPARMYVWAGFRESDCLPLTPSFVVSQAPAKGEVTFKPDQMTMIRHSNSGNCIGTSLAGTGIYYTARSGVTGPDEFTVTATTPGGTTATKTFNVQVIE